MAMSKGQQVFKSASAGREWRGLARLVLESVAAGTVASVILLLAVFAVAAKAEGATLPSSQDPALQLLDPQVAKAGAPTPSAMREGLGYAVTFEGLPQTATPAELEMMLGLLALLAA